MFEVRPAVLSVAVVKMDRQVLDQREFESSRTMELAEYIKSHPFLSSKWSFCYGMRDGGVLREQGPNLIEKIWLEFWLEISLEFLL